MSIDVTLQSICLGEEKGIQIFLPPEYDNRLHASTCYPVVCVLDAEHYGSLTYHLVKNLSQCAKIPDCIVIGVNADAHRFRDYTPTTSNLNWQGKTTDWGDETGGADNFLAFIKTEMLPYVNANYRTLNHRTLIGHSLGGLVTLYSLLTQPRLFHAYLSIDASLWWDHQWLVSAFGLLDTAEVLEGRLYCSLAHHDNDGPDENREMVLSTNRFIATLKERKEEQVKGGLNVTLQNFPDDTHTSVVVPSLFYGLKLLFNDYS